MGEICGDNRFEIIAKAKAHLLDATNIDTSEDEMKVLDSFLFRCWQMGWLDRYDTADRKTENSSEKPNNCEDLQDWKDRMWAEAIVTKPTERSKWMNMKIHYQCSNCGQRFQSTPMIGVPEGMYISGCRVVGDAFYCEDCVKTWADRNGKPFDEQYKDPIGMFTKWWNRLVDEAARAEGKTVKSYRVVNGEYIDGDEV